MSLVGTCPPTSSAIPSALIFNRCNQTINMGTSVALNSISWTNPSISLAAWPWVVNHLSYVHSLLSVALLVPITIMIAFAISLVYHLLREAKPTSNWPSSTTELAVRRYNSTSIYWLPPEILGEAFLFVAQMHSPSLRVCSQVCQKWRFTALDFPLLWTYAIDLRQHENWLVAVLSRSQPMSFKFDMVLSPEESLTPTEAVVVRNGIHMLSCSSRISAISLVGSPSAIHAIASKIPRAAPSLKSISINCPDGVVALPDTTFDLAAPCLRYINLNGCMLRLDSIQSRSLTKLCLSRILLPSFQPLLAVLSDSPLLRTLILASILPPDSAFKLSQPVKLHCLKYIELSDDIVRCGNFLSLIIFPREAYLHFMHCHLHSEITDFTTALLVIQTKLLGIPYGVLRIRTSPRRSVLIQGYGFKSDRTLTCAMTLHLHLHGPRSPDPLLPLICTMVPGTSVRQLQLEIHASCDITAASWPDILSNFSATRHIDIYKEPSQGLLQTLMANIAEVEEAYLNQGFGAKKALLLLALQDLVAHHPHSQADWAGVESQINRNILESYLARRSYITGNLIQSR
ncbi:hypothetical protein BJ138DRAFT_1119446 [Hygrophoropsis aurantiaca]|uniref:Uncharacterized protein n=1 Tax=Hygrophoropsis aurantiaca TaxID=72124 RepID=A0ACB7ZU72_9AGAM|nr:hypothetical protein BJ138DRAFT_1119446 [Hygrophoropsis aurantiaca]